MKRAILLIGVLVSLTAAHYVFGQAQQGVITYETTMNMHRNLPPERQELKNMIPEFRTTKEQLVFNSTESFYKPVIEDEEEQFTSSGGGGVQFRMNQMSPESYINSSTLVRLMPREIAGKKYIVEDTLKVSPWKFGTETKEILGYVCKQAFYAHTEEVQSMRMTSGSAPTVEKRTVTQEITVWYTDKIRPNVGPDRFVTVPGAILAVDINNGERVIVARKIELRDLKKNELKAPSAGTKITQAEFRKMMDEQLQRMRANGGAVFMRN